MKRSIRTNPSRLAEEFMETGRLSSQPILDIHTHMGAFYGTYLPQANRESMLEAMERQNIESIVCAPHSALFDPIVGNQEIREAMVLYPKQVYGYYVVNPHYLDNLENDLAEFDQIQGYVGFKFLPDYHKYPLNGEKYKRIYQFANERGLILLSHTWGHSPYNPPQMLGEIAKKYTNITFLLGHSAPGETDCAIQIAQELPNVYLELCDTGRLNGMIHKMAKAATSEKIVFGTDFPWYDPHYMLGSVLFSGLEDSAIRSILYDNAVRLLKQTTRYDT